MRSKLEYPSISKLNILFSETSDIAIINKLISYAQSTKSTIVLEALDFEGAKIGDCNISKLLHGIPYRKIRSIFLRKCLESGVPIRFVRPSYTSVLGGIFTEALNTLLKSLRDSSLPLGISLVNSRV